MFSNTLGCSHGFSSMKEKGRASPSKIISNKVDFPRPIFSSGQWSKTASLSMKPIDNRNEIRADGIEFGNVSD